MSEPTAAETTGRMAPVELPEHLVDPSKGVIGYVPGAWDMFHIVHLNILRRARPHCDHLMVGVVSDEGLLRTKGKLPIVNLAERIEIVQSIGIVDQVVIDEGSKLDVWQRHPFDVLFKGDDWLGTPKGDKLEADMATVGVRVHYFPYTAHTSSTALRAIIADR